MLTSAMPVLPLRTAATPTIAQSCARRLNFWNDQPAPGTFGHADLGEQLVGGERRLEEAGEEVAGRDRALAACSTGATSVPPSASTTAGRSDAGSPWASEPPMRAAVAHLRVADLAGGVGEERHLLLEQVASLDVAVAGQRADGDVVAAVPDVGEVAARGRRRSSTAGVASRSFISGSSEWPPASSLASSPCSASSDERLVGRVGPHVVERGGDHAHAPPGSRPAASTAFTMLW